MGDPLEKDPATPNVDHRVVNGEFVFVTQSEDLREVEALAREIESAPLPSESMREQLGKVADFLQYPMVEDMFDIRHLDQPEEAHDTRRTWERGLGADTKFDLDQNLLSRGAAGGALNILEIMALFSKLPDKSDEYEDTAGNVPPVLASVAAEAGTYIGRLGSYHTLAPLQRPIFIGEVREFLKGALRTLVDAYKGPTPIRGGAPSR